MSDTPDGSTAPEPASDTGGGIIESAAEVATYPPSPPWSNAAKIAVILMLFVVSLIGLYLVRNVLGVVALASLIAFLIAPLIRFGHRRLHIPRGLALLVAYLVVFLGTLGFGFLVLNSIVESVIELDPVGLVNEGREWILEEIDENNHLRIWGLTIDMTAVVDDLGNPVGGTEQPGVLDVQVVLDIVSNSFRGVRTVAGVILAMVTSAIATVLISMYLNADSERFHGAMAEQFPPGYERDAWIMMRKQKRVWTGYLYGQLVNSLITGFLVFVVLFIVGLPGAFLMGAIMVVLNMIPTFGPILAAIPGVLAALLSGSTRWPDLESYWFALIVAGIYVVVVQAQANIIAPKVMGSAVQLRPAIVLIGLIVGFQVGGLLGSLLAVPIIASLRDVGVYLWAKLLDRDPFPDEAPVAVVGDP